MKNTLTLLIVLSVCGYSIAQTSPVDLSEYEYRSNGVLYLSATDSIEGELQFSELASDKVYLLTEGKKPKKYAAKEVAGFKFDTLNKRFISAKSDGIDGGMLFYENTSPQQAKLYLLRSFVPESSVAGIKIQGGKPVGKWETTMYSPVQKKLLGTNFKKIAEVVKDCPELSDKISRKEKGYYYGLMSLPGVADEVHKNIVTDYNACQ